MRSVFNNIFSKAKTVMCKLSSAAKKQVVKLTLTVKSCSFAKAATVTCKLSLHSDKNPKCIVKAMLSFLTQNGSFGIHG